MKVLIKNIDSCDEVCSLQIKNGFPQIDTNRVNKMPQFEVNLYNLHTF